MRRFGQLLRKGLVVLLMLGLLAAGAWGVWQWRGGGDSGPHFRTEKAQRGRVASLINASGTVVPEDVVDVGAQVAGKIVKFNKDLDHSDKSIDYGSRVTEGLTLAWIDDSLYAPDVGVADADVAVAEADLEAAEADVKKAKADLDACKAKLVFANVDYESARQSGRGVSDVDLKSRQAAQLTAKAAIPAGEAAVLRAEKNVKHAAAVVRRCKQTLERARKNLEYTQIKSPVDGVIIDRRVNIGQTVVASLNAPSLFLIAKDLKKMQVWASVNEADVGRIRVGQSVAFKVDTFPDRVFSGVVYQIRLNALNTQNVVTYTVVVNTDNSNLELLPYLTANLQFRVAERPDALTVPSVALRYRPALNRIAPEFRAWYEESRQRKTASPEMKPGKTAAGNNRGVVWVQGEGGYLEPVRLRLGLTDGSITEVAEVISGELDEDSQVVTGEIQEKASGGENPFAVKMWGGKKKKE
jgi:HlyD family secretion protein